MKDIRKLLVCLPIFSFPFLLSNIDFGETAIRSNFHSQEEMASIGMMLFDTLLPDLENELFAASGVCVQCHGFDTSGVASVDATGLDINIIDDWRATMMANSAKDPFWRAKVSHEVLLHPQHKTEIEDKCVSCHAPLGSFNAAHIGMAQYGMEDLLADGMGQDGVSCLACHQISPDSLGLVFSGNVKYDTFEVAYGPFENPLVSPMLTETGYKPYFSEHISDAGVCASCHTLQTETIDYEGNFTGNMFVEQATYHEWLNSVYKDSVSCQNCHMPSIDKWPVIVIAGSQTKPRYDFSQHELVGGNVTMLKLLRDNIEELDIKATTEQFDEVIAKTEAMLQQRSLHLELDLVDRTPDTAYFEVNLTNLAGHKFPSGYPSRRAFIEFLVKNEAGDTLFISGKTDGEFEVNGQNSTYEPHYQTIRSEEEVQIYEMVMGDVNGNVTTVLERAEAPIKDNRLPPIGFSTTHQVYDTTTIAGNALTDFDFNKINGVEGSGSDVVFYHIPMNGYYEVLEITAKVFYQPTPPKWMKEMFDESTPEIESFKEMFASADRSPVLVKESTIFTESISNNQDVKPKPAIAKIFPSPSTDGNISILSLQKHRLKVFTATGQIVKQVANGDGNYQVQLDGAGIYFFHFETKKGKKQIERVIVK